MQFWHQFFYLLCALNLHLNNTKKVTTGLNVFFYALVLMLLTTFVLISTIKKCSTGTNSFNNYVKLSPYKMHFFSIVSKRAFSALLQIIGANKVLKSSLDGSCTLAAGWFLSLFYAVTGYIMMSFYCSNTI